VIIDSHVHLPTKLFPLDGFLEANVVEVARLTGQPLGRVRERMRNLVAPDPKGERLLKDMDEAGIDKSIIVAVDQGLSPYVADGRFSIIEKYNNNIAEVARAHPNRLLGVAGIDPRRGRAGIELLEKAVKEWGMVGLKLHPAFGFYPNDRFCYPFYAKVQELGIPVFIHTGPEPGTPSKYCQPIHVEDVALDFPDLQIVMVHAGFLPWWQEAVGIASFRPNIYLCLTEWQGVSRSFPEEFYRVIGSMLAFVGSARILFGSDWPFAKSILAQPRWVETFRELAGTRKLGIDITMEDIEAILGGNVARLLRINI
jgi:hypothetical protein